MGLCVCVCLCIDVQVHLFFLHTFIIIQKLPSGFHLNKVYLHYLCVHMSINLGYHCENDQGQVTLASNRDNSLVSLRTSCETVYRQTSNHETPLKGLQWGP